MTEKATKYASIFLFVIVGLMLLFVNLSIIVENEVLIGLTVYHEDTLYVIDNNQLIGRQYIEPSNDIKIGRLINSVQLKNVQKGNLIAIKEIKNYLAPENVEFSEVYAFNNEVKADEATFKDSARGTVYRCEFFDYDSELCLSSWQIYLENVDGEFTAPIGESAYAISGIALQGEEFVIEEITEEEALSQEENATIEEEGNITEEAGNETEISEETNPEEEELEETDIKIVGSYCIFTGEKFKACQRTIWNGGEYAKGYITGGEALKQSSEQHTNEFIYCQELEKPGKKAVNAYLFSEKDRTIKTDFGMIVDCDEKTTTFNEEEFYNKPAPKEEPEITSEPKEDIIVEMPIPEGVTVDEIEVNGLRAYETTRLLSTYGTPVGEDDSEPFQVVLNMPTKWSKKVILSKTVEGVTVNIPKEATRLKVRNEIGEFVDYDVAGEAKTSGNLLTGRAISEELQIGDSENGEKELLVNEPVDEVTIEYELPGPTSTEEELVRSNKKVTIQSDVHYTNVLAYTKVGNVESNQLSLLWLNENGAYVQQAFHDYVDTDNDGRINEVWWVVPSLSGQVYIVISSQEQYNMSVQSALNKNSGGQDSLVGTYPSSCTLDRLSCNDGQVETSLTPIPANNISSITAFIYNNSIGVGDCSSIADVEVIYEWWRAGNLPATTCNITVSNGTQTYTADTACPGNVSNPGISVVNVSNALSGLGWTCKSFFNTTTFPFINATMMRTANGLNFSVDILAFNVTFANDTDVPNVTNMTNSPVNVLRNETIYINATVSDTGANNGLVDTVILQINFSNGTFTNYSTTGVQINAVSANYYNNTVSTNWSGVHSIKWFANDTTGKINNTEISTFKVNDTLPPNITAATETPDPVEYGRAIELNITCEDDVACSEARIQVSFPNVTITNYTATLNGTRFFNRSVPTTFIGTATLTWYANDTSGNANTSQWSQTASSFVVQDTIPPNATSPLETPDPVGIGSVVEVNITCEDAAGCSDAIVQAAWASNGTKINYTTTLSAGRFWNRSIPTAGPATQINLNWTVNDTNNNVNKTEWSSFSIVATNSPANVTNISISPASPNTIDQLNCSYVVILHNQASATVNVTWLNGTTHAESTQFLYLNNTLNSTVLTSGKQGEGETWNCTVNTTDITGNSNTTAVTVVITKPSFTSLAPANNTNFTAGNFNTTLDFTYTETTNQNGDLFIFALNSTGTNTRDGLVYYAPNQANGTSVSYNFTSIPMHSNMSGLQAFWHFDNRSEYGENQTYAFDFSRNNTNVTFNGTINYTSQGCKFGNCFTFDGINDVGVIPSNVSLGNTDWAVSALIKTSASNGTILSNYDGSPVSNGLRISGGRITYIHYDGAWQEKSGLINVSTGTWRLLTWVNHDTKRMDFYVDGVLDVGNVASNVTNNGPVNRLGRDWSGNYFNGSMDDVAIFNRALSSTEIMDIYQAGAQSYYWYANATDGSGYTNKSEVRTLIGTDTQFPAVTSLTELPDPANNSQTIYINATITDNAAISTVTLQVNFSNGTFANYSTTAVGSNYFNASVPTTLVGNHSIRWFANDTSNNVNNTAISLFSVRSSIPSFSSITPVNNTNFTAGIFNTTLSYTYLENSNARNGDLFIFASNSTGTNTRDGLVYYASNQANGTSVSYNFTSIPVYSNSTRLVGLWHFDNRSEYGENQTYAFDFSGNGNNGTASGGIAINDTSQGCKLGGCYSFDGINDQITVGQDALFRTLHQVSVCSWVKPKLVSSSVKVVVTTESAVNGGWSLNLNQNAAGVSDAGKVAAWVRISSGWKSAASTAVLDTTKWTFACFTFANGTGLDLYIDGSLASSNSFTEDISYSANASLVVGHSPPNGGTHLNSTLDEVAIFNRSLSAAEIKDIYRAGSGTYYWYGNATTTDSGTNKTDTRVLNGKAYPAPNITSITPINNTNFTVGTFNTSLNFTYLENVNGNSSDLYIFAWNTSSIDKRDGLVYYAPNQANGTSVSYNFTSIPMHSNMSGLVGLWHFDNRSEYGENQTYAFDFSRRNNNGTAYNGVKVNDTSQICKLGGCYSFDGINDFVNMSDSEDWFFNSSDYAISGWIYMRLNSGYAIITNQGYETSTTRAHIVYYDWAGSALHMATQNSTNSADNNDQSFSWTASTNRWYNFVVTRNGADLKAYIDGVQIGTTLAAGNIQNSSYPLRIGRDSTNYFNGSIDDVAILNRSLSIQEIKDIYRAGTYTHYWQANATVSPGVQNLSDTSVLNGLTDNLKPNVTNVSLTLASPNTSDQLNCSFIISDSNSGDTLAANISWYNASTISESSNISITNGTLASAVLTSAKQAKNENWTCNVTAWDQNGMGNSNITSVVIGNSPPPQVTLSDPPDGNVTYDRSPNLSWNSVTDPDNDPVNYTINISCNGGCTSDNRYTNSTIISYTVDPDLRFFGDDSYNYTWSVLAHDGASNGPASSKRNISIVVQLQLSLGNATMLLGSLAVGATDDTTDDSPLPFNVSNDGNSMIDVNVTATPIFNSSTSMTYSGKVDNTTETGSFNWTRSTTTFTAFSTITNITIGNLNHSNSTDSAEVDVKVVVPPDEPSGNKTSTVTFTAAYVGTPG